PARRAPGSNHRPINADQNELRPRRDRSIKPHVLGTGAAISHVQKPRHEGMGRPGRRNSDEHSRRYGKDRACPPQTPTGATAEDSGGALAHGAALMRADTPSPHDKESYPECQSQGKKDRKQDPDTAGRRAADNGMNEG